MSNKCLQCIKNTWIWALDCLTILLFFLFFFLVLSTTSLIWISFVKFCYVNITLILYWFLHFLIWHMKDRGLSCSAVTEEQRIGSDTFCPDWEPQCINFNLVCQNSAEKGLYWKANCWWLGGMVLVSKNALVGGKKENLIPWEREELEEAFILLD